MAFVGVLNQDDHSITFQRDDGTPFRAIRTKQSEELAGGLKPIQQQEYRFDPSKVDETVEGSPKVAFVGPLADAAKAAKEFGMFGGGKKAAPHQNLQAPPPMQSRSVDPNAGGKPVPQEAPPSGQPGVQLPPPTEQQVRDMQTGQVVQQLDKARVSWGPTPKITQEDRQKQAASATIMPSQGTTKVEGQKPEIPAEQRAEIMGSFDQQQALAMEQRDAEEQKRQMQEVEVERRASVIGDDMRAHDIALARIQDQKRAWEQRLATADEELKNFEIDPQRFFKDRGAWAVIVAAIAQGMGAYGAAMTGSPNFAMQIIQSSVDRDVEAQKQEYLVKKGNVDNLVGRLTTTLGDLEAATLKAKELEMAAAQSYGEQLAMSTGRVDIQTAWLQRKQEIEANRQATQISLLDRAGTTSTAMSGKAAYPQEARAGGSRPLTMKEKLKALEENIKWNDTLAKASGRMDSKMLQEVAQKTKIAEIEGEKAGIPAAIVNAHMKEQLKLAGMDASIKNAKSILEEYGLMDKDGNLLEGGKDVPGVGGTSMFPNWAVSEKGRIARQAAQDLVSKTLFTLSGQAATDAEVERITKMVVGTTDRDFARGVKMLMNQQKALRQELEASYEGTGVGAQRDAGLQRIRELATSHSVTGKAGIGEAAMKALEDRINTSTDLAFEEGPETEAPESK